MKLVLAVQSAPRRLLVYDFATGAAAILVDRVESPTPCAGKVLRERYNRGFEKGLRTSCKDRQCIAFSSSLRYLPSTIPPAEQVLVSTLASGSLTMMPGNP